MFKGGFLLLAFLICNISGNPVDVSYTRISRQNASYKIHNKANFENAVKVCAEEGAELMTPSSQEETDDIRSLKNGDAQPYWTGINTKDRKDRQFVTIRGDNFVPNAFLQWDKNQPDNYRNEEACVEHRSNGKINDVPCKNNNKFICKKTDTPIKEEVVIDNKYVVHEKYNAAYKVYSKKNFDSAAFSCILEDAQLFVPSSQQEFDDLIKFENINSDPYWVGIFFNDIEVNDFINVRGEKFVPNAFLQWNVNEPNNHINRGENCVQLGPNRKLSDVKCSKELRYICKKELKTTQPIKEIQENKEVDKKDVGKEPGSDIGKVGSIAYTLIERQNALYKIHEKDSFDYASMTCQEESADLYIPTSQQEMEDINKFTNGDKEPYWIGVHIKDKNERQFVTVRGVKFVANSFLIWDKNQPDNFIHKNGFGEDCVQILPNGKLNDTPCQYKYKYICKKELSTSKPQ